ncbi:MAG: archease [Candidatus Odinarchaeia archaeon]
MSPLSKGYRELPHTADVYLEVFAPTIDEAFEQAGLAVFDTMTDIRLVEPKLTKEIEVEAEDLKSLLFEFIRELLYLFDVEGVLYSYFKLKVFRNKIFKLKGIMKGEKFNPAKHSSKTEVKAPTYSQMEFIEEKNKILIRFVLDI